MDEKWADMQEQPKDQGFVEEQIKHFYQFLKTDYITRSKKKGLSPKTALTRVAAIADFYRRHNEPLNIKLTQTFKEALAGRPVNETEKMSAEQIESLTYYAPSLRDKAFIWVQYQSGSDVSTVCNLTWGHVAREIASPPHGAVMLKGIIRKKDPSKTYVTFIYKTAIKHLKEYLTERWGRSYHSVLEYDSPLFMGEGKWINRKISPKTMQSVMKDIAAKSSFLPKGQLAQADVNPLRPHALRASFSDRMAKAGANKVLVDYLMGHKLSYDTAYFGGEEGLREAYVTYAKQVLEPQRVKGTDELESEFHQLIEVQAKHIQRLTKENEMLKARDDRLEDELRDVKRLFYDIIDPMVSDPKVRPVFSKFLLEAIEKTDLAQPKEGSGHVDWAKAQVASRVGIRDLDAIEVDINIFDGNTVVIRRWRFKGSSEWKPYN
ncbi:MAG: site-specific integrase [Candidatus Bathyarchaeota archaeon]|nr:site-specific integrase [Candidatus Bathyarchaeota archaeon]